MNSIKQQPTIHLPNEITFPRVDLVKLSNGIRLHSLHCTDRDVLRLSLVFRNGSSHQPLPFCSSATANMLDEGSSELSSKQIAERLDYYGSYYSVSMDRDYIVLTFACLSKYLDQTLDVARHIILDAVFPEDEFEIYCENRKELLSNERRKTSFLAREHFSEALFGSGHPYGERYSEELYDNLKRDHLVRFYKDYYVAERCFAVCSGKIEGATISKISSLLEAIPTGGVSTDIVFPAPTSTNLTLVENTEAIQSSIRIGRLLFTRNHPDFIPMQVVSTVLGGYYGSRLLANLRERNGYTYGIFSGISPMQHSGFFAIATDVGGDVTKPALDAIYSEVERMGSELVSDSELDMVRNVITGEILRVLEGPFGVADVTIEAIQNGLGSNYLHDFSRIIKEITPSEILSLSQRYLPLSSLITVVAGAPSTLSALEK